MPQDLTISYNSTFNAEIILQGPGLSIHNYDFQTVDWRTEKISTIQGQRLIDVRDGYLHATAQYDSFKCPNTGVHRAVLELPDYTQFQYELPSPLLISGKHDSNTILQYCKSISSTLMLIEHCQAVYQIVLILVFFLRPRSSGNYFSNWHFTIHNKTNMERKSMQHGLSSRNLYYST
jgi:hypothetical protein